MKTLRLALLPLVLSTSALAQESAPEHVFSLYARTGARVYLSSARTVGGVGGGVGLRDTYRGVFLFQVDAAYLTQVGNVLEVRAAAGLQLPGVYSPAARVLVTALAGSQLSFLQPDNPVPVRGPAAAVGVGIAPLRFTWEQGTVSLLELDVGLGSDLPGTGVSLGLGLLEISFPL
jgi:hypothetical protein